MNHFVEEGERKEEHVFAFTRENLMVMCYFSSSMLKQKKKLLMYWTQHSPAIKLYSFKMHSEKGENGQS